MRLAFPSVISLLNAISQTKLMKTTLITGASAGIGLEFARQSARRGQNLVLVARSADKIAQLAGELARAHNIQAYPLAFDLTVPETPSQLFAETTRRGLEVETLINNAGFGSLGSFTAFEPERDRQMIELNITSLVQLTHLYIRPMRERRSGAIINVASTAAFQPVPYMATYAATKAFVLSFSEALWEEYRAEGIKILALCPGATDTNFFSAAKGSRPPYRLLETPEQVVQTALKGLTRGQSHIISGWSNFFLTEMERFLPRSVVARIAGRAMRSAYGADKNRS